jgi:uncharacterized membrane protein
MTPPDVTLSPGLVVVVVNVTAPTLFLTVRVGGTKMLEFRVVVDPAVAEVCTIVVAGTTPVVGGGRLLVPVTVSV